MVFDKVCLLMVRKLVFVRTMLFTGVKLHFKTRLKQSDVPSENKLFADAGKSTHTANNVWE